MKKRSADEKKTDDGARAKGKTPKTSFAASDCRIELQMESRRLWWQPTQLCAMREYPVNII